MKQKIFNKINKAIKSTTPIILVLAIAILIFGVKLFYIGYHNVDLGHNMRYLEQRFNTIMLDRYDINKTMTPSEMVIIGNQQQEKGFLMSVCSIFIIGLIINQLTEEKKR